MQVQYRFEGRTTWFDLAKPDPQSLALQTCRHPEIATGGSIVACNYEVAKIRSLGGYSARFVFVQRIPFDTTLPRDPEL